MNKSIAAEGCESGSSFILHPSSFILLMSVLESIRELLTSQAATFREVHHPPTFTSAESAIARGEELRVGGKALLLKGEDDQYRLFVLPADRKVDSSAIRKKLGFKRLRFASSD